MEKPGYRNLTSCGGRHRFADHHLKLLNLSQKTL